MGGLPDKAEPLAILVTLLVLCAQPVCPARRHGPWPGAWHPRTGGGHTNPPLPETNRRLITRPHSMFWVVTSSHWAGPSTGRRPRPRRTWSRRTTRRRRRRRPGLETRRMDSGWRSTGSRSAEITVFSWSTYNLCFILLFCLDKNMCFG